MLMVWGRLVEVKKTTTLGWGPFAKHDFFDRPAIPCRKRARSAPPPTSVAHSPKANEASANRCSTRPLQPVRRISSATSHQKKTAKVRPNMTATAIAVDLTNAILQPHSNNGLDRGRCGKNPLFRLGKDLVA
jgi:hypothetical protein